MKTTLRMRSWLVGMTAILFGSFFFTACKKSLDNDNPNADAAGLMAFNLATDKQSVGFSLSGSWLSNSGLTFNSYTGGYIGVYTGARSVESFDFINGSSLATSTGNFEKDKYYSVFAIGRSGIYRTVITQDNLDELSGTGSAFIRYINAIADSSFPTVTVRKENATVTTSQPHFGDVSAFVPVDAGEISVAMTNNGTIQKSRTFTVESRKIYTVLLAGHPGSTGTDSLQIRYITNGALDENAARTSSQNRTAN